MGERGRSTTSIVYPLARARFWNQFQCAVDQSRSGVEPRRQYKYAWRKGEEKGEYVGIKGAIRSLEHIRKAAMKKKINEETRKNSYFREA